jgi:hypothetical protein
VIVDPGISVTDFGYDASNRITSIRTPLVNDWLAANTTRTPTDADLVQIAYGTTSDTTPNDGIDDTKDKVDKVTLPAPEGRPAPPGRPPRSPTRSTPRTTSASATSTTPA